MYEKLTYILDAIDCEAVLDGRFKINEKFQIGKAWFCSPSRIYRDSVYSVLSPRRNLSD